MPQDLRVIEMADGSNNGRSDRLLSALQLSVANLAGAASTPVVTAVTFPAGSLPPNYAVFIEPQQPGVFASTSGKTSAGFNVTLTPLTGAAVAAGAFNVMIFG
jgi:hypothetical protein